jgi:hypothetical protein
VCSQCHQGLCCSRNMWNAMVRDRVRHNKIGQASSRHILSRETARQGHQSVENVSINHHSINQLIALHCTGCVYVCGVSLGRRGGEEIEE